MERNTQYIIFALLIIYTSFFDQVVIHINKYVELLFLASLFYYAYLKKDCTSQYTKPVLIFNLCVLVSCVNSYFLHGQKFFDVIFFSQFAFGLLFYYVLLYYDLTYKQAKDILLKFSVFFCICYFVQWYIYPIALFGGAIGISNITEDSFRMRMSCSLCSYILFFYGFCSFFKTKKITYFIYSIAGFFPMIMMGFRSLMGLSIAFLLVMFINANYRSFRNLLIYPLVLIVIADLALNVPLVQDKIEEMELRNENEQTLDNEDYIRYISFAYYSENVFDSYSDLVFGAGAPCVFRTRAGEANQSSNGYVNQVLSGYDMGLYWNDLGLIGLGFIIGFPAICIFIYVMLSCAYKAKDNEILYIRYSILTALLGSVFTTQEIYRAGNFIILGLLLYIEYRYNKEKKSGLTPQTF